MRPHFGISIGRHNAVVAFRGVAATRPDVIANENGDRATPAYVAYVNGEVLAGSAAKSAVNRFPMHVVSNLVSLLRVDDVSEHKLVVELAVTDEGEGLFPSIDPDGEPRRATEVMQHLLRSLRTLCSTVASADQQSVFTFAIPRGTDHSLFLASAEAAGFPRGSQVIFDDVASGLFYQLIPTPSSASDAAHDSFLVLDWGAGGASISIIANSGGLVSSASWKRITGIGGNAIDTALAQSAAVNFQKKYKLPLAENARAMRKIGASAETCKIALSATLQSSLEVEAAMEGMDLKEVVSRSRLEGMLEEQFLRRLAAEITELVKHCTVIPKAAVLGGGSLRIPRVQQFLRTTLMALGVEASRIFDTIAGDEVAALGACVQSSITKSNNPDIPIQHDCNCLGCGLAVIGADNSVTTVLEAGTVLPCTVTIEVASETEQQLEIVRDTNQQCCLVKVPAGSKTITVSVDLTGTATVCVDGSSTATF